MLKEYPQFDSKTLAVKLTKASETMVKKGHPWVFDKGIEKINKEGKLGDLAIIFDRLKNSFLAIGLYDPDSPIRIKILQAHIKAKIDADWFEDKILKAYDKRKPLLETKTNSFRLLYGESDGLPGIILDVYAGVAVLKLYSAIWLPYLKTLIEVIDQIISPSAIMLRLGRKAGLIASQYGLEDGNLLHGRLENPNVVFEEFGIKFMANVIKGHKTGYFLDHRQNRKQIGEYANGKKVLDVFSYAGGFSVHALVGGAAEVISLDISKQALELSKQNVKLNDQQIEGKHMTLCVDAFEGLQNLVDQGRQFDLVVIDPPSFAKSAKEVSTALISYKRLAKFGASLVKPKGILLLASCSSRIDEETFYQLNENILNQGKYNFELFKKTSHDIDHPITIPESAYLKSGYYRRT